MSARRSLIPNGWLIFAYSHSRAIKIGDKEVEYNASFRLILHTKLANPHYKPEMQAQTTLINFTVTRDGLEDQLLAEVVKAERPDLEELKAELTKQQNDFKIMLKRLEDDLLSRLSSAGGNILGDTALVENLETTKRTAAEIEVKVAEAKITSQEIDVAREFYRPAAARASLLYFILNDLNTINPIYQFSLKVSDHLQFASVFLYSFLLCFASIAGIQRRISEGDCKSECFGRCGNSSAQSHRMHNIFGVPVHVSWSL